MSNGDAKGGSGQIVMSLNADDIEPAPGWTRDQIAEFLALWDKWHLNDMRPNCPHQVGPEWEPREVSRYNWTLDDETSKQQRSIKAMFDAQLKKGQTVTPTPDEARILALEYWVTTTTPEAPQHYAPSRSSSGYRPAIETKETNWLTQAEHPDGYLSKPCPVCGYRYGTAWKFEEVPAEVIAFMESLPDTDKQPAWV